MDDRWLSDMTLLRTLLLVATALIVADLFALAYHIRSVPVIVLSAVASGVLLALLRRAWGQPEPVQMGWIRMGLGVALALSLVTILSWR